MTQNNCPREGQLTIDDARRFALRLLKLVNRPPDIAGRCRTMRLVALSADEDLGLLAEEAGSTWPRRPSQT